MTETDIIDEQLSVEPQEENTSIPGRGARLGSMILDHIIMTFSSMIVVAPFMVINFMNMEQGGPTSPLAMMETMFPLMGLIYAIYFSKDIIGSRSPGKRIVKCQVFNASTGEVAAPWRTSLRNVLIPLWPIEVIATLISPSRRLGDFIAGTKVMAVKAPVKSKLDWGQILLGFLVGIVISGLITGGYAYWFTTQMEGLM